MVKGGTLDPNEAQGLGVEHEMELQ